MAKEVAKTGGIRTFTYYVRDASGNPMATYQKTEEASGKKFKLIEQPLYGADRLGLYKPELALGIEGQAPPDANEVKVTENLTLASYVAGKIYLISEGKQVNLAKGYTIPAGGEVLLTFGESEIPLASGIFTRQLARKQYELTDHLGNMRAVITDQKEYNSTSGTYSAKLASYANYYAFGMQMPGRDYTSQEYRYGFNGKEKDTEGMGGGGSTYDYGFRIYNPQIAKFLSVDPLTKSYPWYTPYQFAGHKPIESVDLDGLEEEHYIMLPGKDGKPIFKLTHTTELVETSLFSSDVKINQRRVYTVHGPTFLHPANDLEYEQSWTYDTKEEMLDPNAKREALTSNQSTSIIAATTLDDMQNADLNPYRQMAGWVKDKLTDFVQDKVEDFTSPSEEMLGKNGPIIPSKTIWRNKNTKHERIDVENPNPGQRAGQVHYQDENNIKYMYSPTENKFYGKNKKSGSYNVAAPNIDKKLKNSDFKNAIEKGLRMLKGE